MGEKETIFDFVILSVFGWYLILVSLFSGLATLRDLIYLGFGFLAVAISFFLLSIIIEERRVKKEEKK